MNQEMMLRLKMEKLVAAQSDKDYEQAVRLGKMAAENFINDRDNKSHKSQINQLKQVCFSARRISDIYDFIKKQTGRNKENKEWRKNNFGKELLNLMAGYQQTAQRITEQLEITGTEEAAYWRRQVQILLCREFVKHLSAQFTYSSSGGGR